MSASAEMPKYLCHKEVWALKILELRGTFTITRDSPSLVVEEPFAPIFPGQAYFTRHNPQPGGYFVRCEDGYESYSPAKAFEEDYERIR